MATTKKTTTEKKTTTKKAPVKRTTKPKLEVVKEEPAQQELSVFEKMAIKFPFEQHEVKIAEDITVNVRNRIGLGEMVSLVRNAVDTCIDEDRGEVHFELVNYVTKMLICTVYCSEIVPANNEAGYLAVSGDGHMYEQIESHIDQEQLSTIWHSVRETLRAKHEMFSSAAAKVTIDMLHRLDELYELFKGIADNFDGEEAVAAVKKLGTLVGDK